MLTRPKTREVGVGAQQTLSACRRSFPRWTSARFSWGRGEIVIRPATWHGKIPRFMRFPQCHRSLAVAVRPAPSPAPQHHHSLVDVLFMDAPGPPDDESEQKGGAGQRLLEGLAMALRIHLLQMHSESLARSAPPPRLHPPLPVFLLQHHSSRRALAGPNHRGHCSGNQRGCRVHAASSCAFIHALSPCLAGHPREQRGHHHPPRKREERRGRTPIKMATHRRTLRR